MLARYSRHTKSYKRPFRKTRSFKFLLILTIVAALFVYWSMKSGEPPAPAQNIIEKPISGPGALLTSLEGSADVKSSGAADWEAANANSELQENDTIRTNGDGRAILQLPDKSFIRMDANTEISFIKISPADIAISQNYGHAFHRVNDNTPIIYRVKHGNIELTALGTAFDVAISGRNVDVLALANETKIKIYGNDESLFNLETLEQGSFAKVNPDAEKEKSIVVEKIDQSKIADNAWLEWNKNADKQNDFFLGMLGDLVDLTLTQPTETELSVNKNEFTITGKIDPAAEIIINENNVENKNGEFAFKTTLKPGANAFQIIAKKNTQENRKKITVSFAADEVISENAKINLTAQKDGDSIKLSWTMENIENPNGFITLVGATADPTYPAAPSHLLPGTARTDTWKGLANDEYHVKVCLKQDGACGLYSNEIILMP